MGWAPPLLKCAELGLFQSLRFKYVELEACFNDVLRLREFLSRIQEVGAGGSNPLTPTFTTRLRSHLNLNWTNGERLSKNAPLEAGLFGLN